MAASGTRDRTDERIDVLRRHGEPAHFIWRGELYRIREVIAHWIQVGAADTVRVVPSARWRSDGGARVGESAVFGRDKAFERELWSVRASVGREGRAGVFQLCHDLPDSSWLLVGETVFPGSGKAGVSFEPVFGPSGCGVSVK